MRMGTARFLHRFLARQTMRGWVVGDYDRMLEACADFYLGPFCGAVVAQLPEGAEVLDLGTGTGQLPVMLARVDPALRVTGIDLSERCLQAARANADRAGVADRVRFMRADLSRERISFGPFDCAVSTCSLHHWRYPTRMLRGIARCLKHSGNVRILDDSPEVDGAARRAWIDRVAQAAGASRLFRMVFQFESRLLAYSRSELEPLCRAVGLEIREYRIRDVFFEATLVCAEPHGLVR